MKATFWLILLTLCLGACDQKDKPKPTEASAAPSTTTNQKEFSGEDVSPDSPIQKDSDPKAGGRFNEHEKRSSFPKAEELFPEETLAEIDQVLERHPDIRSVSDMAGNPFYMEWRQATLPEFQWDQEMSEHLQEGIRTVAESQGIDPDTIGTRSQPRVEVNMMFENEGLRRAIGHVVEGDLEGYRAELKRAIDHSVRSSLSSKSSDATPIRISPHL